MYTDAVFKESPILSFILPFFLSDTGIATGTSHHSNSNAEAIPASVQNQQPGTPPK